MENNHEANSNISKKTFLTAVIILLALLLIAGIMTRVIPSGSYDRQMVNGNISINTDSFHYTNLEAYPVWKWFTAPIEVLWSEDGVMIIAIIFFIIIIGGSVNLLNKCNILKTIINKIVKRFEKKKYYLLAAIVFAFMLLGALIGIFEEIIPLVPVILTLSYYMGWDSYTGLGITLLATGFGFSAAISNPFTIGVAQNIAGLPMFSGAGFRILIFFIIYGVVCTYLIKYAKKVEKKNELRSPYSENSVFYNDLGQIATIDADTQKKLNRAVKWFTSIIILLVVIIILASFIEGLSDYNLPIIGLLFLIGGIGSAILSGMKHKNIMLTFLEGCKGMAPGIILILLATGVKHIISSSGIMDTILYYTSNKISHMSQFGAVMAVYMLVLFMNFFIGSASAKAFLIMPILAPLADIININRQILVLAFQFGDGFSNVIFPTNAVLLISLGLTKISYPKWFKWVIKLQLIVFALTSVFLWIALKIGYGPF